MLRGAGNSHIFTSKDSSRARYERIWRSKDGNDIGLLYCENFHHAMWEQYDDRLDVKIPEILTKDDPHCKFVVTYKK